MPDIDVRLARQAVGIAVSKALEDVKGNARRSIRNLIDLGLLFSQTENQKWFFGTARRVVEKPKNPYRALVSRAVRDIDGETIRRVGLNLGYNALTSGAKMLRKKQEELGMSLPWMLDVDEGNDPAYAENLACCLEEGQELGIHSYALRIRIPDNLSRAVELAKRYDECFFALRLPSGLIDDAAAERLAQAHNMAVSVDVAAEGEGEGAFRRLRQNRCLYGYFATYEDEDVPRVTSPQFIRWGIGEGCLFGAYQAAAGATQRAKDRVYEFACKLRGESGQPLIALDWPRDIRDTGERMRLGGLMAVNLAGKALAGCREERFSAGMLADLFRGAEVCPA
jgi:hypothetical protein